MEQPTLDKRHRDKNGRIARKHGNTFIGTLRRAHGDNFAPNESADTKLIEALEEFDELSLHKLVAALK